MRIARSWNIALALAVALGSPATAHAQSAEAEMMFRESFDVMRGEVLRTQYGQNAQEGARILKGGQHHDT